MDEENITLKETLEVTDKVVETPEENQLADSEISPLESVEEKEDN
jgi:hypothetical protein